MRNVAPSLFSQTVLVQRASHMTRWVNNLSANAGDSRNMSLIPGLRRSSGGGNRNPVQYLAWVIQWTEEPGGLQSMGSQRVGHD